MITSKGHKWFLLDLHNYTKEFLIEIVGELYEHVQELEREIRVIEEKGEVFKPE